jgi:hypothetical protein
VPAAKWSINKPASRRAQPAVAGRGLSEGLGSTALPSQEIPVHGHRECGTSQCICRAYSVNEGDRKARPQGTKDCEGDEQDWAGSFFLEPAKFDQIEARQERDGRE